MKVVLEEDVLKVLEVQRDSMLVKAKEIQAYAEKKGLTCNVHHDTAFVSKIKALYPKLTKHCSVDWNNIERVAKDIARVSRYYDSFITHDIDLEVINYKTSTLKLSRYNADLRFILEDLNIARMFWEMTKSYKNGSVEITFTNADMFKQVVDKILYSDPRTDKVVNAITDEDIKECKANIDYDCFRALKMRMVLEATGEDHHINWNKIDLALKHIKVIK